MNAIAFDTIVAPATALGRAALAIVRIDGPAAEAIARELTGRELPEREAVVTRIHDRGEELDESVAIRYAAPRSFTGNDLVELTLHGSPLVVQRVIEAVVARGARMAEPGEFTERAVLNGKIDLIQAEAIGDLIDARTRLQAQLSIKHLEGDLSRIATEIRATLLHVISRLEAGLDFSEEGYEFIQPGETQALLQGAAERLASLAQTYARGRAATEGLHAVILGQPNAGKSTLLNFLCGTDRAIVTPLPGTTRDLIRETIEIGGLPVTVVDTAGLRHTEDAVETIGVGRARDAASGAEIVIYLVDASRGLEPWDREELERWPDAIVVYTKTDLAAEPEGFLGVSVRTRDGVDRLMRTLDETVRSRYVPPEGSPAIVNERQRRAVAEAQDAVASAIAGVASGMQDEIVLVDLGRAANALGSLVGAISSDDVYREIFSKFCIGK